MANSLHWPAQVVWLGYEAEFKWQCAKPSFAAANRDSCMLRLGWCTVWCIGEARDKSGCSLVLCLKETCPGESIQREAPGGIYGGGPGCGPAILSYYNHQLMTIRASWKACPSECGPDLAHLRHSRPVCTVNQPVNPSIYQSSLPTAVVA